MNTVKPVTIPEPEESVSIDSIEASSVTITQASSEDIELITRWTLALHQHEDDGQLAPHPHLSDNLKKWLLSEINNSNSLFLVAHIGNQPVGFIAGTSIINDNGLIANPLKGFVQLLWIEPDYRTNNLASQLLGTLEQCFSSIGIGYVECQFTSNNQLASHFWANQGYKVRASIARKMMT